MLPKKKVKTRTAEEKKAQKAAMMIRKTIEPQISKIVEVLNKHLIKDNLRVGCEITWYFDELEK